MKAITVLSFVRATGWVTRAFFLKYFEERMKPILKITKLKRAFETSQPGVATPGVGECEQGRGQERTRGR